MASKRSVRYDGWAEFTTNERKIFNESGPKELFGAVETAARYSYWHAKIMGIKFHSDLFNKINEYYRESICESIANTIDKLQDGREIKVHIPSMNYIKEIVLKKLVDV